MPLPEPLPSAADSGGSQGRPRWLVPVAVVVVVALVAAGATFLLAGGGDEGGDQTATDTAGEAITLEAASNPGDNPFTTDLTVNEIAAQPDAIDAVAAVQTDLATDDATGTLVATGTTTGLYGGTTDDQACDPAQLAEFLTDPANADKATAWAAAQGDLDPADIDEFVAGLTPVVLTTDTWVTNNGFENGRATPYQAVLQAGTAVLVDDTGTPRTKCSCGNPLTQARTDGVDPASTTGEPWDGYATGTVAIVEPGDPTDTLTLTDLDTGQPIEQPIGAGTFDKSAWIGKTIDAVNPERRVFVDGVDTGYYSTGGACLDVPTLCAYGYALLSANSTWTGDPTEYVLLFQRKVGETPNGSAIWQVADAVGTTATDVFLDCEARGQRVMGVWTSGAAADGSPPAIVWSGDIATETLIEVPPAETTCEIFSE
jgi:hypothetical protein